MTDRRGYETLLQPGETALWEGRPEDGPLLNRELLRMSLLMLLGHTAIIAMVYSGGNLPWGLALGGWAAYLLIDGFAITMDVLSTRRHLRDDRYLITDRRVLILAPDRTGSGWALSAAKELREINRIELHEVHDSLASLVITPAVSQYQPFRLLYLSDAQEVTALIDSLQEVSP